MKHLLTLALLTALTALTVPLIQAQEVIILDLSAETIGEKLIPASSKELPLNRPGKVVTNELDSVTVDSTAQWGGSEEEKIILIKKNGGAGFVSTTWEWSPFVASAEDSLEVSFQLYLAGAEDQGNFMIALNDISGPRKAVTYLQIDAQGKVAMLDTSVDGGKPQTVTNLMTDGVPNHLKLLVNYENSTVTLIVDGSPVGEPLPFPEGLRANQLIFFSPGIESIQRTVGVKDLQVRYVSE